MKYLDMWFMWMPARWASLSINPNVNYYAYNWETMDMELPCYWCGTPTTRLHISWENPICSPDCSDNLDWDYACAVAGRKRFIQWRFWWSVAKRFWQKGVLWQSKPCRG